MINNLDLIQGDMHLVENIQLFTEVNTQIVNEILASGVDPDSALREKSGKIEIVEVDVPGIGRP